MLNNDPDQSDYNRQKYIKRIKKINMDANKKLEKLKTYAATHPQKAVVAYIQFQSMNGKEKFLRAMQKSQWRLPCMPKQNKMDYKQ